MFQTISDPLLINLTGDYGNVPEEIFTQRPCPIFTGGKS
jgi:hypothetical protein